MLSQILQKIDSILSAPCPIYSLTGYFCPGCGGRRALLSLLHGDLLLAVCYHPGVVYLASFFLISIIHLLLDHLLPKHLDALPIHYHAYKFRPVYLYIALAIILLNVAFRDLILFLTGISLMP